MATCGTRSARRPPHDHATVSCPPPRQRLGELRAAASDNDGPDGDSFADVVRWLDVLVREDGGLMQVDALAARLVLLAEEHAGGLCPTKPFGGLGMVLRRTAAGDIGQSPLLVSAAAREVILSAAASLVRSFVRPLVRLFARPLVRSFARSLVH